MGQCSKLVILGFSVGLHGKTEDSWAPTGFLGTELDSGVQETSCKSPLKFLSGKYQIRMGLVEQGSKLASLSAPKSSMEEQDTLGSYKSPEN